MSPDRIEVALAVLEGKLSADHLTMDELDEIEARVHAMIMDREIEKALGEGKIVFSGIENGVLN